VGVTQVLFTWGQVGAAIRAAREGLKDADDQLTIYQQAVARDVSAAFYNVLLAKEFNAVARQNLDQKQRHLRKPSGNLNPARACFDVLAAGSPSKRPPEVLRTEHAISTLRETAIPAELDGRWTPRN
jgi:HAE1 family hydrophobic/amphiphilic exporter-1